MLPPSPPVESGCTVLRYSYLADPITYLTVSISNEYTGDATTPGLGNSYLEITFTGDTTVAQTDSLPSEGQELNRGDCIITVYLRKPKSSIPLPLRRKSEPGAKVHGHTMLRTCLHCVLPCFFTGSRGPHRTTCNCGPRRINVRFSGEGASFGHLCLHVQDFPVE